MRPSRLLVLVLGGGLLAVAAQARVPHDFRRVVALMQPVQRERLQAQAVRWGEWSREQRRAFGERAADWAARPLAERRARRESWRAWERLTPAERMRLREESLRIARLPEAERNALRERFAALDDTRARGWMLGPVLGADYMRLQPLLAQAPLDQHDALLHTLRLMSPLQRADLGVLVQRTPPAERDRLRRELVSTSDANRDAWLRLSLER